MSKKIALILHRKSANRPEVKAAVKAVAGSGIPIRVRIPWNKKDKARVVEEAIRSGAKRIIAGGGDGTINAVVDALVGKAKNPKEIELGILPLGTANDFAKGCGLPKDDLEQCLRIACLGKSKRVDVGRVNKKCFINVASLGFGAEVTATTPQEMKEALGGGAYTLMGMAKALKFDPYHCRVLIPGEEPLEGDMLIAAVGNNRFAGGGFDVAPRSTMRDGLLDLAYISQAGALELPVVLKELEDPCNAGNRYLHYRQLAEFTIECETGLHCNLDGEPFNMKRLKFSVLPRQLRLVMGSAV